MKLALIIIKIFVIAALLIISNQDLSLATAANREHFTQEYTLWIAHLFEKGMSIASYVVKNEWLPGTN